MNEEETKHTFNIIEKHKQRLHILEVQAATLGISTPPHIIIEITEIKSAIERILDNIGFIDTNIDPNTDKSFNSSLVYPKNRTKQTIIAQKNSDIHTVRLQGSTDVEQIIRATDESSIEQVSLESNTPSEQIVTAEDKSKISDISLDV